MSEGEKKSEVPAKKWPWTWLDPMLQRAAWVIAIITGISMFLNYISISKPNMVYVALFAQLVAFAFAIRIVFKIERTWRSSALDTHFTIFAVCMAFYQANAAEKIYDATKTDVALVATIAWYTFLVLWLLLSVIAAGRAQNGVDKKFESLEKRTFELAEVMSMMTKNLGEGTSQQLDLQSRVVDVQTSFSKRMEKLEADLKQLRIAEVMDLAGFRIDELETKLEEIRSDIPKKRTSRKKAEVQAN